MTNNVLIMAHRGFGEPENSIEAFKRAIEIQADYIEFDIHLTKDNVFVVHHDPTFAELGNTRPITELTMKEIEALRLSNDEPIPTLKQVIAEISPKINLNIELKTPTAGKALVDFLEKHPPKNQFLVSSFHQKALLDIHLTNPNIETGFLFIHTLFKNRVTQAINLHTAWLNPYYRFCTKSLIKNAHKNNLKVNPWTVNSFETQLKLIKNGINSIITDNPVPLIQHFNK